MVSNYPDTFLELSSLPHMRKSIKSCYSCVNQLLAITHETFSTFDDIFENRKAFFEILNVFDKVWH